MKLSHNGAEWTGTFQTTLGALLSDVIQDGPFDAVVHMAGQYAVPGVVVGFDEHAVYLRDQGQIPRSDILAIEVV